MTHHERLSSQLYKTTYADGTNVYINYGTSDASADGYIVPGKDYLLFRQRNLNRVIFTFHCFFLPANISYRGTNTKVW